MKYKKTTCNLAFLIHMTIWHLPSQCRLPIHALEHVEWIRFCMGIFYLFYTNISQLIYYPAPTIRLCDLSRRQGAKPIKCDLTGYLLHLASLVTIATAHGRYLTVIWFTRSVDIRPADLGGNITQWVAY